MRGLELELKSRIESDSVHHQTLMSQRQRELNILKKAAEQQKRQIAELETQNHKQQLVIKRKTEKVNNHHYEKHLVQCDSNLKTDLR